MPLNTGYGLNISQNLSPTNPYISTIAISDIQVYSYQPLIDREQNEFQINPTQVNSLSTNYVSDDYPGMAKGFALPTAESNVPFTVLNSVSSSVASIATIKNSSLCRVFNVVLRDINCRVLNNCQMREPHSNSTTKINPFPLKIKISSNCNCTRLVEF